MSILPCSYCRQTSVSWPRFLYLNKWIYFNKLKHLGEVLKATGKNRKQWSTQNKHRSLPFNRQQVFYYLSSSPSSWDKKKILYLSLWKYGETAVNIVSLFINTPIYSIFRQNFHCGSVPRSCPLSLHGCCYKSTVKYLLIFQNPKGWKRLKRILSRKS